MATNTVLANYALYDFNDKQGRVPFLDNSDTRTILVTKILGMFSLSP